MRCDACLRSARINVALHESVFNLCAYHYSRWNDSVVRSLRRKGMCCDPRWLRRAIQRAIRQRRPGGLMAEV